MGFHGGGNMSMDYLNPAEKKFLLSMAWDVLRAGVAGKRSLIKPDAETGGHLMERGASFVTLQKSGELRGCIGSLTAWRPLWEDVAAHAWNAAFEDPRFSPVKASELSLISLKISILTPPEPLLFDSEVDLLSKLQPGVDGLTIRSGRCQATFLPAVWEQLPEPEDFLVHLKLKAGLRADAFPKDLKAERYGTDEFA